MTKCWATVAMERPTFEIAAAALKDMQKILARSEADSIPRHALDKMARGDAEMISVLGGSAHGDDQLLCA